MIVHALVCAYNEAPTVGQVVTQLLPRVTRVTVVDDGSKDATSEVARAAGAQVLRQEPNQGKSAAVRTGLQAILASDATHVLFIDADLQHDPAEVPQFLEAARAGAPFVIGSRFAEKSLIPRHRYLANAIGGWFLGLFAGVRLEDTQSGYRLVEAGLLRRIPLEWEGFGLETEMLLKAVALDAKVAYVPIRAIYIEGRQSRFRPIRDTVRISLAALRFRLSRRRQTS